MAILLIKYDILNISKIINNILGLRKLSTKLVAINPQKKTKETLPIKIAAENFLKDIFDKAAAILTRNAGVKGMAIKTTNKENFILSIFCINKSQLGIFLTFLSKKFWKK